MRYCSSTEHEENWKYPMEEGYTLFINNDEISNIYNKNPPENGGFVSSLRGGKLPPLNFVNIYIFVNMPWAA